MKIKTIPHDNYEKGLAQEGNFIIGQRIEENIIVYQAFNDRIADYAIKHQKFGGEDYSFTRVNVALKNKFFIPSKNKIA